MTYALPWHYSTTELKGLFIQKLATFIYYTIMGLLHNVHVHYMYILMYIIYVHIEIYVEIYIYRDIEVYLCRGSKS
jgi:hypothetical protein